MANVYDKSLVSQIENWIVETVGALSQIQSSEVIPFPGFQQWEAALGTRVKEIMELGRFPAVIESWIGMQWRVIPDEQQADMEHRFIVAIVQLHEGGTAAERIGESATVLGTHGLMEVVRLALHDKQPNLVSEITDSNIATDQTKVVAMRPVATPKGQSIVELELVVREAPNA